MNSKLNIDDKYFYVEDNIIKSTNDRKLARQGMKKDVAQATMKAIKEVAIQHLSEKDFDLQKVEQILNKVSNNYKAKVDSRVGLFLSKKKKKALNKTIGDMAEEYFVDIKNIVERDKKYSMIVYRYTVDKKEPVKSKKSVEMKGALKEAKDDIVKFYKAWAEGGNWTLKNAKWFKDIDFLKNLKKDKKWCEESAKKKFGQDLTLKSNWEIVDRHLTTTEREILNPKQMW